MAATEYVLLEEDSSDVKTNDYNGEDGEDAVIDDDCGTPITAPFDFSLSSSSSSASANIVRSPEVRLVDLQKRISKSCGGDFPLRKEALVLLEQASKSMANVRKKTKIRNTKARMVAPLYKQLDSLRNLIPQFTQVGESSCVITDALVYLEQLKREIQVLQKGMKLSSNVFSSSSQDGASPCCNRVEVVCLMQRLRIHVCCEKRDGLIADLMLSLETLGLVFQYVNVSYRNCLVLEALTTQENVGAIGEAAVRQAILRAIYAKA